MISFTLTISLSMSCHTFCSHLFSSMPSVRSHALFIFVHSLRAIRSYLSSISKIIFLDNTFHWNISTEFSLTHHSIYADSLRPITRCYVIPRPEPDTREREDDNGRLIGDWCAWAWIKVHGYLWTINKFENNRNTSIRCSRVNISPKLDYLHTDARAHTHTNQFPG